LVSLSRSHPAESAELHPRQRQFHLAAQPGHRRPQWQAGTAQLAEERHAALEERTQPNAEGFVVWSVGWNLQDDWRGSRPPDDARDKERRDQADWQIRVP